MRKIKSKCDDCSLRYVDFGNCFRCKGNKCEREVRAEERKYLNDYLADERAKTIEELRSFINRYYENIVFELKSGGKIEDANRVLDKFAEQLKEQINV